MKRPNLLRRAALVVLPIATMGALNACPPTNPRLEVIVLTMTGQPVPGALLEVTQRGGDYSRQDSTREDGRMGWLLPEKGEWAVRLLADADYQITATQENPIRVRLGNYDSRRVEFRVSVPE
jgi:hypothetical protein